MHLHIYKDATETIEELANWMISFIDKTLSRQERFTITLSGGETPKALYKLLSTETYRNKIEWSRMHIFWGDERVVPFNDESNNAKMAFDNLLNDMPVPKENIHIMQTDIDPSKSAADYEKILHQYFDNSLHSFDLVLLGMGNDGHTLSLFPFSSILSENAHWANAVYVEAQKKYRITLMPSIVNKAIAVIFLVTGEEKAEVLQRVLKSPPGLYPAQLIQPQNGELHWFLDRAAWGGM